VAEAGRCGLQQDLSPARLVGGDLLDHEVAGDLMKNGSAHSIIMARHGPAHPAQISR
jgi:hypothetical protein